ncbi:zinc finger protein 511 [Cimex lectularius]|uniref:C2H2-type domain-containing protein n=1 Tax=Cimex lectularius TaxID=79782 RepID=A0A8I6RAX4_CIMLE|nr:zinc finger protein 511 [Cimex lectularius]
MNVLKSTNMASVAALVSGISAIDFNFTKQKMDISEILTFLKNHGTNIPRSVDDPFFDEGNEICRVYTRVGIVDEDDEFLCHEQLKMFTCEVINCSAKFDNLLSYDMHYNSCHRFSCSECKKQFISPHLLDLHLSEIHDSFFKAQAERKPMYVCFVESCSVVSKDAKERKKHCIEEHKFPHDFKFTSDPRTAKKTKPMKKKKSESMEVEVESGANQSPPKPALPSFTFGKRRPAKTFDSRKLKAETNIEMKELLDNLPS